METAIRQEVEIRSTHVADKQSNLHFLVPRRYVIVILIVILSLAAFVRLFRLTKVDVTTDEALIGFRSIGYLDFMSTPTQKTPPEWYDPNPVPAWTKLSFHDHPPLTFLLQHFSFKLFGENHLGLRLPFVLAGIGAVWLTYLVGRQLFGDVTGLAAAGLLGISAGHGVISRLGLQESLAIFFLLLALYFFVRALENPRWLLAFGASVGGGILVKYTTVFLLPALLVYLLVFHSEMFRVRWFWLSALTALLVASPVILYNIFLFNARGHFDLQLSYLLKQNTPEWTYLLGKIQIGTFSERLNRFPVRLLEVFSIPWMALSILAFLWALIRRNRQGLLLVFAILFLTGLLFIIGPEQRFITLYAPFFALLLASSGTEALSRLRWRVVKIPLFLIGGIWILYEAYFAWNTVLALELRGRMFRDYARIRFESFSWGYAALNEFLDGRLNEKRPAFILQPKFEFVARIIDADLERAKAKGKEAEPLLIVMDENMWNLAGFWTFTRRGVYHGWPVVVSEEFLHRGASYYADRGFKKFLFARAAPGTLQEHTRSNAPKIIEQKFMENGVKPFEILNPRGEVAFRIYEL